MNDFEDRRSPSSPQQQSFTVNTLNAACGVVCNLHFKCSRSRMTCILKAPNRWKDFFKMAGEFFTDRQAIEAWRPRAPTPRSQPCSGFKAVKLNQSTIRQDIYKNREASAFPTSTDRISRACLAAATAGQKQSGGAVRWNLRHSGTRRRGATSRRALLP